jgi:predicted NAD-dependent protein-ADP-ribosyltransferase YbiA (DUF1768 family)
MFILNITGIFSDLQFRKNIYLAQLLIGTGDQEFVEGNTRKDTYWGQCPIGTGENNLGKILMQVRKDLL